MSKHFNFEEKYVNDYNAKDLLLFSKSFLSFKNKIIPPKPIYLRKSEAEIMLG